MHGIPDIFGGTPSDQIFLGGYRADAGAEPMFQEKSEYHTPLTTGPWFVCSSALRTR